MKRRARPRLANVLFEVTPRCNLRCRYCYAPWTAPGALLAAPERPGYARAERTLNRLFREAEVGCVTMTGGEPLLAERLPELVLLCRRRGAAVNVITNGTAGTRADYEPLVALGVGLFELPLLAADPAVHDRLTGAPGSWRQVVRSLGELRALGAGVVAVVVLTGENHDGLASTLDLVAALGVRRVMLNRFNPGGRGLAEPEVLGPTAADLRCAFATADALAPALGLEITANVGVPHCVVDPHAYRRLRFTCCSADLARRPLALDLDGRLRFCNHSPVAFADLFAGPLAASLACDYLAGWRTIVPAACRDCRRFRRCFGGCRAACEQLGLGLDHPDPLLAQTHAPRN